jgi:hypothetical protein
MMLTLSDHWRVKAVDIGMQRHAFAMRQGYENYGVSDGEQSFDVKGAVAECGVAAYYRQPWLANVGNIKGVDVGKIIEVRGRPPGGDLGFRPKDKPKRELPVVLVWVNDDYSMRLMGWLYGYECCHEEGTEAHKKRWNAKSGCWYNPPPYRLLDELSRLLENEVEVARIVASIPR